MFGTILAVFDGYSRTLERITDLLFSRGQSKESRFRPKYLTSIVVLVIGSLIVISQFGDKLKEMVDFATIVSFLIAPVIAIFNFRLVTGKYLQKDMQPLHG